MSLDLNLDLNPYAAMPPRIDFGIGAVGAGFIMRDVHLKAYADAGFNVVAITSRTPEIAQEVADLRGIPRVCESLEEMLDDQNVEILDIAVPPDKQPEIIRTAVRRGKYLKGILAQKPLAVHYDEATEIVRLCEARQIPLGVNQNMRYDRSIRVLKTLLEKRLLGTPVLATIEMRAVPHWQTWLREYGRLTLLNMSIHHIDTFRYLFGEAQSIYASVRKDPRTQFAHEDGICLYIMEYEDGLRAAAWDDVWAGPRSDKDDLNPYIKWRVEGTQGLAEGTLGWPEYPNRCPSTLTFTTTAEPGMWITPKWREVWFPDAFQGPMADLIDAIARQRQPAVSGADNLGTLATIEAGYRSIRERRPVDIAEIYENVKAASSKG
ncbi:MAG TPA: Gfo/Idh/MocA family oxidoreductase [Terracidiphilus sp.]|jgi:predicted dehydrogenase